MRKTSQDGGDSTSITSGIENEIKKPGSILKTKRNSIKRKVQNLSHESDETVIEPLLQKDKEKPDTLNQKAKYNLLSKSKTDSNSDRGGDKDKLIQDDKSSAGNVSNVEDNTLPTSMKEATTSKFTTTAPLHNHMNTNIFSSHDSGKGFVAPKTQILVEIDGSKQGGYNPSPLIFTTAKIHTDGKTKHMEPVQVTPVPILSTIEVSLLKSGSIKGETSGLVNSNISAVYSTIPKNNINVTEKDQKSSFKILDNSPTPPYIVGTKVLISKDTTADASTQQTKNLISSLPKDPTTNQYKLNTSNLKKDNSMENKSTGEKDVYQTKVSTPQTIKTTVLDETKKSVVTCDPTKLVETVYTKAHTVNNPCKSDGIVNQPISAVKTKTDVFKNPEKKTESSNDPNEFSSDKTQKSDNVNKIPDKTTLNSTTSTNSRQLQRQNIVIDGDDPNLKLEPHIKPKNNNENSQKSDESLKSSSATKNATQIKSMGNDSFNSSDKTILPKQSANSVPASNVSSVPISTAASVNKTAASKSTPASVHKSSASIDTTISVNKPSTPIVHNVPVKNPLNSADNSQAANKSLTPITKSVSKLPSSIANTTAVKKSPINTTTTVGENKTSAVSATKMKTADVSKNSPMATTTVGKKVLTSNPLSSVKATTSSTVPTSSNQLNSKSTVFTKSSTEPSTTLKNNAANAITSGSAIKSGTTKLNSTTISPATSTVNAKSTASTINTKTKVSTNPAAQPNVATTIKSPTGIKSPTAATSKSVTQPKIVSKLDNPKESLTSSGKASTTVTPGITNVIATTTTTTALDSSVSSSKAAASNKKSNSKSNELSNGSKIFKA